MENPNFLKQKYNLHNASEVESAAERTEIRTDGKVPQNPEAHIQNYLDRFKEITDRKDPEERERGIEALKKVLIDKFVTTYEEIPESYWKSQENIMRERGQLGDWQTASEKEKEKTKQQLSETLLADQEASLEQWIDYIVSSDSDYMPDYLKYWVFRSITGLQEYDKDKKEFRKRTNGDVKQFPDLNQEALSYLIDSVLKKYQGESPEWNYDIQPEEREKFQQYLNQENFSKLYGWSVEQINPIPEHLLLVTEGEWKKYDQGSDHKLLNQSIQSKGTGWCTAGENTAKTQLSTGDFYVYYTLDDEKNPTIPRIAIRMEGDSIAEVRGIAYKQNLDPYIGDVLAKKLEEFPDKEQYLKKERDMKQLTEIDRKTKVGEQLIRDELVFLYEIDNKIEGFGYQTDPRIAELRDARDVNADLPIIFECAHEDIAHSVSEIGENTKVYIGELEPGIFNLLPEKIEHMYTKFPEEQIKFRHMLSTGITDGVEVSVGMLGFKKWTHYRDIGKRAEELGLELYPEPGLELYPTVRHQQIGEYLYVDMKMINDSDDLPDRPRMFGAYRPADGLWLDVDGGRGGSGWVPKGRFVFLRPHKSEL